MVSPKEGMERLLTFGKDSTIPMSIRLHNPSYDAELPASRILYLLSDSKQALLTLRRTCKTTKDWVRPLLPIVFEDIYFHYPVRSTPEDPNGKGMTTTALNSLASHVQHLYLTIIPSADATPPLQRMTIHSLFSMITNVTQLTVKFDSDFGTTAAPGQNDMRSGQAVVSLWHWPTHNLASPTSSTMSHHVPVNDLRYSLELNELPQLETLVLINLSITGVLALRSAPLQRYQNNAKDGAGWMSKRFWAHVRHLDVRLVKWWDDDVADGDTADTHSRKGKANATSSSRPSSISLGPTNPYGGSAHPSSFSRLSLSFLSSPPSSKQCRRDGLKILHAWLTTFAAALHSFSFAWLEPKLTTLPGTPAAPHAPSKHPHVSARARLEGYPEAAPPADHDKPPAAPRRRLDLVRCAPPAPGHNPLALDRECGRWFTAAAIVWTELREIRIDGVRIGGAEVASMRKRAARLRRACVRVEWIGPGVGGGRMLEEEQLEEGSRMWVVLDFERG